MVQHTAREYLRPERPKPPTGPKLDQLFGMVDARAWGENVVHDLRDYFAGRVLWDDVDPGCVLYGPPGTGKTTFASALAHTTKLPLIATSFGNWQASGTGHLGDCLSAINEDFDAAKAAAPCVFFIDELDSLPKRQSGSHGDNYYNAVVNHVLKRLDALKDMKGVVVVGACNHPDMLDEALVRAGRMDHMIAIPLPTLEDIPKILYFHLGIADQKNWVDLSDVAVRCQGMSGAELERVVRLARRISRRDNRQKLFKSDLVKAIETSCPQLDHVMRRRVAVHEAGHAIAAIRCGLASNLCVTIVAKDSGGRTTFDQPKSTFTRTDIDSFLVVLMAGRAAEEIQLSIVSSGAGGSETSDLARATRLATDCVTKFGLSERGLTPWIDPKQRKDLHYYPKEIRDEVMHILTVAYDEAKALLKADAPFLSALTDALLNRHALSHAEILALDPANNPCGDFWNYHPGNDPYDVHTNFSGPAKNDTPYRYTPGAQPRKPRPRRGRS